ncbi:hypothetical protein FRX31_026701 [Thalictrum thalictroides]|uniref:Uncharacterized protein n=1 Tax=Thalictrum thalictroides TaxID=46969 RepID=A0A7J6VF38_THATH|nr:hypothetical protein FRX31_026701 [Thalictrum thalictroides]
MGCLEGLLPIEIPSKEILEEVLEKLNIKSSPMYFFQDDNGAGAGNNKQYKGYVEIVDYEASEDYQFEGPWKSNPEDAEDAAALVALEQLKTIYPFEIIDVNLKEVIRLRKENAQLQNKLRHIQTILEDLITEDILGKVRRT